MGAHLVGVFLKDIFLVLGIGLPTSHARMHTGAFELEQIIAQVDKVTIDNDNAVIGIWIVECSTIIVALRQREGFAGCDNAAHAAVDACHKLGAHFLSGFVSR